MANANVLESKKAVVTEIRASLDKCVSVVLVDSRGLTVEQDTDFRKKLREAGVDYKVYKNSMINFAVQDTKFAELSSYLSGPTAVAFSYDDATAAARIIAKELANAPNLEFKAGFIENVVYDAKGIKEVADMPSRPELLATLLGSFKSPMSSFARLINQIAENGGEVAPKAVEATVEATETVEATTVEATETVEATATEITNEANETNETNEVAETVEPASEE